MIEDAVAPDQYDPGLFVDRELELRQIHRKVEEGLAGYPITQPVIHIWGLRGIGKSWLLSHIRAIHAFAPGKRIGKDGSLSVLIDFAALPLTLWEPGTIADLFAAVVEQIKAQLGSITHRADRHLELFQGELAAFRASGGIRGVTQLADQLAALINHLSATLVPLLLFDATDRLEPEDFFWLESHLIEPVVRNDQVIVVVSGRKEIPRWLEFGVRQRLVIWELREFDREGARQQLAKRGHERLSDVVYGFSFGHPYASQVSGDRLHQLAGDQPLDAQFLHLHADDIAELVGQIEAHLLDEVKSDRLREALRILSVMRKFNIESARSMLGRFLGEEYKRFSDASFLKLFEELERTTLAWWSKEQRGYAIAPALRRIIDLCGRKKAPAHFVAQHEQAFKLYKTWMQKYPHDRSSFLAEALFQLVSAAASRTVSECEEIVDQFLRQALLPEYFTTDNADALFQIIYRDAELQDPTGVMPDRVYVGVLNRIREFRDQIAQNEPVEGSQDERGVHAHSVSTRSVRESGGYARTDPRQGRTDTSRDPD